MLIWRGHGILILVFAVIGGVAASMAVGLLYGATHWGWLGHLLMCIPFWGAAAGVWLYATTMGKPTEQTFIDPSTGRPVVISSSHTLFFIPAFPWAIIVSILAAVTTVLAVVAPLALDDVKARVGESKGAAAFETANDLIDSDRGPVGYGNTPAAVKLAEEFSAYVKLGRKLGVQAATKPSVSLSNGKFLTYCRLNKDSCVFMVHVPSLRKFSSDAKEYMAGMAWAAALGAAETLEPKPKQVAVGLRGIVLYDTVIVGHPVAEGAEVESGIENRYSGGSPQHQLFAFFEPPAKPADPARDKSLAGAAAVPDGKAAPTPEAPAQTPAAKSMNAKGVTADLTAVAEAVKAPAENAKVMSGAPTATPTAAAPAAPTPPALPTQVREWKDTTGRILKASLESFTTPACDIGHFKREDGQGFDVPVARLSAEDQALIGKIVEQVKPPTL